MISIYKNLQELALAGTQDVPILPRVVQFPVNDVCNSRCQMCEIWQQKKSDEVSPEKLREVFAQPLFRKVQGIGINGGEPTLRRDLPDLVRAAAETLPKLAGVSLITNAIRTKNVIEKIDALGEVLRSANVHFDVMVSLDGVGKVHDQVRGREGNFESAVEVLEHLRDSGAANSYRIGCTIIRDNVLHTEELLNWASDFGVYARFRVGIPHQRLYTADKKDPFALNEIERFHLANFLHHLDHHYEQDPKRRDFYRSLRGQVAYGHARTSGCDWKDRGVTLFSTGHLGYCAVKSKNICSTLDGADALKAYEENADHLRDIRKNDCSSCHHDYEGFENRAVYIKAKLHRLAKRLPPRAFLAAKKLKRQYSDHKARRQLSDLQSRRVIPLSNSSRSKPSFLLCGWYGTETLGDRAILAGVVTSLKNAGPCQISVASLEPYVSEHTKHMMPELADVTTVEYNSSTISEYDAVIMAGGPLMSPVTECLKVLDLFSAAKAKGISTALFGVGIGPLAPMGWRREMITEILEKSDHCSFRDHRSKELASSLVNREIDAEVIPDPSRYWLRAKREEFPTEQRNPQRILLGLRDWHPSDYAQHLSVDEANSAKKRFEEQLLEALNYWYNDGRELIPFCMHKQPVGGDDRFFYQRLLQNAPEILANLDWQHRSPEDDFQTFCTASQALTMRFHSTVFALEAETPFTAIDYTSGGKVKALCSEANVDSACIPLESMSAETLITATPAKLPELAALDAIPQFAASILAN